MTWEQGEMDGGAILAISLAVDSDRCRKDAADLVRRCSLSGALSELLEQGSAPDENVRKYGELAAEECPDVNEFVVASRDSYGKVRRRRTGLAEVNTESFPERVRYLMEFYRDGTRRNAVRCSIDPLRQAISSTHKLDPHKFAELLSESSFVPPGKEDLFAEGIVFFLEAKDHLASRMLFPQLEDSLRHMLNEVGYLTRFYRWNKKVGNTVEEEISLGRLLNPSGDWRWKLEKVLPAEDLDELDLLFNFRGGANLRNESEHGKFYTEDFTDEDAVYGTWYLVRLALAPLLAKWELVEAVLDEGIA